MENPENRIVTIASFLRTPKQGAEFPGELPYHVPITPEFLVDEHQLHDISSDVERIAQTTRPFRIEGGNVREMRDGADQRLLADPRPFQTLHRQVMSIVINNGGEIFDNQPVGEKYRPYVALQKRPGWLLKGDERTIPGIDVIWRDLRRDNLKIVLAHYAFESIAWTQRLD